jgi:hypothetical protein
MLYEIVDQRPEADGRGGEYFALAAWPDRRAKRQARGIKREINGRAIVAPLFQDFHLRRPAVDRAIVRRPAPWTNAGLELLTTTGHWLPADTQAAVTWQTVERPADRGRQIAAAAEAYLALAEARGWTGDRRGTVDNLICTASSHDADERASTTIVNTTRTYTIGTASTSSASHTGHYFANATVPQGATIDSAVMKMTPIGTAYDDARGDWYGELSPYPGTFSASNGNLTNRTLTTASAAVHSQGLGASQHAWQTDVTAIVQEIVNQAAYAQGSPIVMHWRAFVANPTRSCWCHAYDGDTAQCGALDITYTAAAGDDARSLRRWPPAPAYFPNLEIGGQLR